MTQEILKEKLETIRELVEACLQQLGADPKNVSHSIQRDLEEMQPSKDIALQIVNKVGDCEEDVEIQNQVLDKPSAEGRILLVFYISYKYFKNEWLTSGDLEKITTELGVRIDKRNVTNYLKEFRKYLESGAVRKRGQSTPYRLNRKGAKRFEEIICEKEN